MIGSKRLLYTTGKDVHAVADETVSKFERAGT